MLRRRSPRHGLGQAVQEAADLVRGYYLGSLEVRVTGVSHALERSVEEELFAIAREALTNAARHKARPSRIGRRGGVPGRERARGRHRRRRRLRSDHHGRDVRPGRNGERAGRIGAALTLARSRRGTEIVAVWPND